MILIALIVVLLVAGLLCWLADKYQPQLPRWIALAALLIDMALIAMLLAQLDTAQIAAHGPWLPNAGDWSCVPLR